MGVGSGLSHARRKVPAEGIWFVFMCGFVEDEEWGHCEIAFLGGNAVRRGDRMFFILERIQITDCIQGRGGKARSMLNAVSLQKWIYLVALQRDGETGSDM